MAIRGIINEIKNLFLHKKKVVVDKNVLMSVAISCQISFDFLSSSGWHSADQKEKGKDVVEIFTQSGKIPLSFFTLVGKDLETIGEVKNMDLNEYGRSNIRNMNSKKFAENRDRTLTQNAFIRRIARSNNLQIKDADDMLKVVIDELLACLREGLCVKLQGLGTIGTYTRKGRVLEHNAIVGGRCESQDKTVVKLVPSQKLNASLRRVKI